VRQTEPVDDPIFYHGSSTAASGFGSAVFKPGQSPEQVGRNAAAFV